MWTGREWDAFDGSGLAPRDAEGRYRLGDLTAVVAPFSPGRDVPAHRPGTVAAGRANSIAASGGVDHWVSDVFRDARLGALKAA